MSCSYEHYLGPALNPKRTLNELNREETKIEYKTNEKPI